MTAKEKAIELVDNFMEHTVEWDKIKEVAFDSEYHAKQCALIAVDEILKAIPSEYLDYWKGESQMVLNEDVDYWNEVKQEIEKL